jgi:hypothetical protein
MWLKITPPSGRTRKASAKVASDKSWLTVPSAEGKNRGPKTIPDMVP